MRVLVTVVVQHWHCLLPVRLNTEFLIGGDGFEVGGVLKVDRVKSGAMHVQQPSVLRQPVARLLTTSVGGALFVRYAPSSYGCLLRMVDWKTRFGLSELLGCVASCCCATVTMRCRSRCDVTHLARWW